MLGAVDHDGGEAAVDAVLAQLEIVAVVQMHRDGQVGRLEGGLDELHEVLLVGVLARAGGNLEDEGRLLFGRRLDYPLDDLHVVDVEGADREPLLERHLEHFFRAYQWHANSFRSIDTVTENLDFRRDETASPRAILSFSTAA